MKKDQLKIFVEVIEAGSINKAAKLLYISQPSLSRSLHDLESEMGKALLVRSSTGVKLTPTGKTFYTYAKSILSQFQALDRLKNLNEDSLYSKLSISVSDFYLKDDLILQFYNEIRSTATEIQFIETTADVVLENVSNSLSELGITILNDYQLIAFRKMAELKEIELETFGRHPLYIHIHESREFSKNKELHSTDLLNHTYIHLPYDFFYNLNLAISVDGIQLSDFTKTITMSNYHAIIKMLQNTDSFIIGNKWQQDELKASHIASIPLCDTIYQNNFVIIKRKRENLSFAGKNFLNLLSENYKNI